MAFHFHLFGSWRKEYHKAKEGTLFSGSILPKGVSKAVKDEILFSCADKWYFAIGSVKKLRTERCFSGVFR